MMHTPTLIAHRGYGHADQQLPITENTLEAFYYAAKHGAKAIEFDVRCCQDHNDIIFHDATLSRFLPSENRPIETYTLTELRTLLPFSVCTLTETLELCQTHQLTAHVEIKDINSTLAVYETLQPFPNVTTVISSFERHVFETLIEKPSLAHVTKALLYRTNERPPVETVLSDIQNLDLTAIHTSHHELDPQWVTALQKHAIPIRIFTVNNRTVYRTLTALQIDAVFTDQLELLQ